jgi:undecaprenyl-diphosphatase
MLAGRHPTGIYRSDAAAAPSSDERQPRSALLELLVGYVSMVVVLLVIGGLLTRVLDGSVGRWDLSVNRWFVSHRDATGNAVSGGVTFALDTFPVIAVALIAIAFFSWRRRFRAAWVIGVGLVLEIAVFLSVTFVVARPRPDVARLSSTPMTSSFPSGHAAAAVVLYGGIALGVHCCTRRPMIRAAFWIFAALAVLAVAVSRVYRGMHHPTDVAIGALFGAACLWFAWRAVQRYFGPMRVSQQEIAHPAVVHRPSIASEVTT